MLEIVVVAFDRELGRNEVIVNFVTHFIVNKDFIKGSLKNNLEYEFKI